MVVAVPVLEPVVLASVVVAVPVLEPVVLAAVVVLPVLTLASVVALASFAAVVVVAQHRDYNRIIRRGVSLIVGGDGWWIREGERNDRRDLAAMTVISCDNDWINAVVVWTTLRRV